MTTEEILQEIYVLCGENKVKKAVLLLYRQVNSFLLSDDLVSCDDLLDRVDLSKTPLTLWLGFLRILYPAKDSLKNWESFQNKIVASFYSDRSQVMEEKKRERLEKKGWVMGGVKEFLGLTEEEMEWIDDKVVEVREGKTKPQKGV